MRYLIQKSTALRLARFGSLLTLMGALTACQTMQAMMGTPEAEKKAEVAAPTVEPIPVRSARASMIAPIVETRETITATGYAVRRIFFSFLAFAKAKGDLSSLDISRGLPICVIYSILDPNKACKKLDNKPLTKQKR